MAYTSREIPAATAEVFEVLVDPWSYPDWLLGASVIRRVDKEWPAVGSRFHHMVGVGPLSIPDNTKVESIVANSRLQLRVRARPFILATATFTLLGDDDRCVVMLEEEPIPRFLGNVARPILDPMMHVRNHLSLERLANVVVGRKIESLRHR